MGPVMQELSHPITDGMMVYPGDPHVCIEPGLTLSKDGVEVAQISMGSHTGTHLDAPSHTIRGGRTTSRIALSELTGEALVIRLLGLDDRQMYGVDDVAAALGGLVPITLPSLVVIDTNWAKYFGTKRALVHPYMSRELAAMLVERGMHVLVVDTLSPDPTRPGNEEFPVHEVVLGRDRLIVENITNLAQVPDTFNLGLFPLRIDADGAPVRAVAFEPA